MGNVACSLGDSGDCPPHQHLARRTVAITLTLAVMKCILLNSGYAKPRLLFSPSCQGSYLYWVHIFIKPRIVPFCVLTCLCMKCNQREDNQMLSTLNGCSEWKWIWARSRLKVTAAWCSVLVFSLCFSFFKLFGWNTHSRIFRVFLVAHLSFLCLYSSPVDSLGLRVLALLSHSVLKFYVCFRYFEELLICRDFPHQFFMLSSGHVFHEGWGKLCVRHNEGLFFFTIPFSFYE